MTNPCAAGACPATPSPAPRPSDAPISDRSAAQATSKIAPASNPQPTARLTIAAMPQAPAEPAAELLAMMHGERPVPPELAAWLQS